MEISYCDLTTVELSDVARDKVSYLENVKQQIKRVKELLPERVNPEVNKILSLVSCNLERIKEACENEETGSLQQLRSGNVSQKELSEDKWKRLGSGGFSSVFLAKLKGNFVAVKVLNDSQQRNILMTEGNLLRHVPSCCHRCRARQSNGRIVHGNDYTVRQMVRVPVCQGPATCAGVLDFRHDNIVAFRGTGKLESSIPEMRLYRGQLYIVMEYIKDNLYKYIEKQKTPENKGLPKGLVWLFAKQIANGLSYLHGLDPPIAHRDLKPDNILLDTRSMHLKLADFGLSRHFSEKLSFEGPESVFHARWTAPELWETEDNGYSSIENSSEETAEGNEEEPYGYTLNEQLEYYISADMYSYGQVVAYMVTGDTPWSGVNSLSVVNRQYDKVDDKVVVPDSLKGQLRDIINLCRNSDSTKRPEVAHLLKTYFSESNPYQSEAESAEFFSCGFLNNTKIFVADSLVDETSDGYLKTGVFPQGYPKECLKCLVEVGNKEHNGVPKEWIYEHQYRENYQHFRQQAIDKKIEDNPAIALKRLATPREEEEERQEILLQYSQSTYCHHRAMREIWRLLDEPVQREIVPCKSIVHPVFSTSFGLHVAVLTADKPQKFIFSRRSNREGMATPGKFTCGAVESASVKDYIYVDDKPYVDLVQTAVRGLEEELRVELKGRDIEALCLTTVYLKFDTHEWGMCGFVDLADPRVAPERQLTFSELGSRFTTGPKDKFEHEEVVAVDFELPTMVEFVRENFNDFASSGKLVVVKVLQSFFGVAAVERMFKAYV